MSLWITHRLRKGKCNYPPSKWFYVSTDVTFNEHKSYFTTPYLQGENSTTEDKDKGEFQDLFLSNLPSSSKHVSESNPMSESMLVSDPVPQNQQEKADSALENVTFDKEYSSKKIVPENAQVQVSNLDPENEVIISKPSLHGETESHVNNNDQDLPIAISKWTRECTK